MEEVQDNSDKVLKKEALTELKSLAKREKVDLFDRDLSWLRFNKRVLLEAQDESVPLYERIKFLAIYSSNMDEFFRVRFSIMRRIARLSKDGKKKKIRRLTGFHDPAALIKEVLNVTHEQQELYGKVYRESIIPSLKEEGVILYTTKHISDKHAEAVEEYFYTQVLSFLQPIVLNAEIKDDIFLENRKLYHAVDLRDGEGRNSIGIVNIPSPPLSRFVTLEQLEGKHHYAFVDDIVRAYVHILFPGYTNQGVFSIKLNRDAELFLENELSGTVIEKIKKNIVKRDIGNPSRFLFDKDMPSYMVTELQEHLGLVENDLVPGGRYHNMFDHFSLPNPVGPQLEYVKLKPLSHPALQGFTSVLDAMYKEDILLHFPYQRYDYILRYFNEAIISKQVKEVKVALYRVAEDSHVVNALISAARNGKKVTVFVEAKARFDEENNLKWAARMEEVGIDVRFSNLDLKVHSKVALLIGEDHEGKPIKYAFFGTGNFNEKTAAIYADHALLTCDSALCDELDLAFEVIFGNTRDVEFKHLLVAQVNMVETFIEKIDREATHAKNGLEARMIIKLNNLQDPNIIQKIYDAADAGVDIVLIVRAISCAKPRKNLRIIRLVDKYLEHARAYWFFNSGEEEMYLGSADWMERNLYRRIEVVFPLYNKELRKEIHASLQFQINDNQSLVEIAQDMSNVRIAKEGPEVRAQNDFYDWLVDEHQLHR